VTTRTQFSPGPASWQDDLSPLPRAEWSYDRAAHLLAHAGFGGAPESIQELADSSVERAVERLVHYERIPNPRMQPFVESGFWDPSLSDFPDSRPAATDLAEQHGVSMGVATKPSGNRPIQPVSERGATGNLRDLTIEVARNPAMLYFLDAQFNVKGAPNENFAREVMELFTMGVGNYTERDVRECARAFTGWYFDDLAFKVDPEKHDAGSKEFLGRTGNFDGVDVIEIIFEQPVTAEFLAAKIYRFLVRDELSPALRARLGAVLRDADYELKPLLTAIFTSKDFYSAASYGAHIKGPVEHLIAMLKHLGAESVPGVPDFNQSTIAMGQQLLNPPSVAGWAGVVSPEVFFFAVIDVK
jgi:hypothetical protein